MLSSDLFTSSLSNLLSLSLSASACVSACDHAIKDEPPINVTANKNQPSSYRFTQVNQRNLWSLLDSTSQIPLKTMFFP